jgi:hypothetical protein
MQRLGNGAPRSALVCKGWVTTRFLGSEWPNALADMLHPPARSVLWGGVGREQDE